MNGWMGQVATVNLTQGAVVREPAEETVLRTYLGGRGLGVKLLADRCDPTVAPLSPDNKLVIAVGPLTGSAAPTAGRFSVVTRSPLTGTIFDANSGGFWGPQFKACGLDAMILEGAAPSPVYLFVDEDRIEVRDARDLWGLDVHETTDRLRERHGKPARVACIGPAGERLVRVAAIMNDYHRAAGRGGVGAVMGSKRLKAIVVDGSRKLEIADRAAFGFLVKEAQRKLAQNPVTSKAMPEYGTAGLLNIMNAFGLLGTRNYQRGTFEAAEQVGGESLTEQILVRKRPCFACPIACGRETATASARGEGPEFETIYAFGPMCLVDSLEQIAEIGYDCNRLGMDTISLGVTIACAMEISERGLLDEPIGWGDAGRVRELVRQTGYREGLGDELADGARRLAERYGLPDVAMHVKGLELPAYDPRGAKGMGLAYATSNRGGCHLRAYMIGYEVLGLPKRIDRLSCDNKAGLCVRQQDLNAAMDSLVECRFVESAVNESHFARQLAAVTGVAYRPEDLLVIGERIWNLERLFNLAAGFTRADDTLPRRLLAEPLAAGGSRGQVVELASMLDEYYDVRGWTRAGVPTPAKLAELGLVGVLDGTLGRDRPVHA
ncbi:MAG: aldehyde ferredoxin oxidoreductase family protein [Chloroflexi bacterium]|nr:aldehyde ferredoxin oxidoreductase family protein [Chloroflexota bacterium]